MKVIVAEKPSVARDIARVLGVKTRAEGYIHNSEYAVTWAIGHLVTLMEPDELDEKYKRWSMKELPILPESIPLKVLPKTKKQFAVVKKLMNSKETTSIICATDSAREGELIFRYIYQMAKCKKPVERLWISSMTDAAIKQGFNSLKPASHYDALYESAKRRGEADWLVGMNASRAFTLKFNALLPIGRVQTPTLALLVKRDAEIESFVPKDYYELRANFGAYEGLWRDPKTQKLFASERSALEKVKTEVLKREGTVTESVREKKRVPPPALYDLTSLQRAANARYGFSADKTLKLMQALYERHKLITYPRTDSRHLPPDMRNNVISSLKRLPEPYISLVNAKEMNFNMSSRRVYDQSKVRDHHAVVLTERRAELNALTPDESKIYDMVARSLIAAHYPDYEYESLKAVTRVNGNDFVSTGVRVIDPGFRKVTGADKPEQVLPDLSVGDVFTCNKADIKAQKTKPPARLTDATLLGLMEHAGRDIDDEELRQSMKESGLGTPATRAQTIERLIKVGYAKRSGKTLVSTQKGRSLISVAPEEICSAATTGRWEKALSELASIDDIAVRQAKSQRFIEGIRRFSVFLVEYAKASQANVAFEREPYKKKR